MKTYHYQLLIAILSEVAATSLLKSSNGLSRPWYAVGTVVGYSLSFYFLSQALKVVPIGIAYAMWSGVGIIAVSLLGWLAFGQKLDTPALVGIGFILCGVLITNLLSKSVGA